MSGSNGVPKHRFIRYDEVDTHSIRTPWHGTEVNSENVMFHSIRTWSAFGTPLATDVRAKRYQLSHVGCHLYPSPPFSRCASSSTGIPCHHLRTADACSIHARRLCFPKSILKSHCLQPCSLIRSTHRSHLPTCACTSPPTRTTITDTTISPRSKTRSRDSGCGLPTLSCLSSVLPCLGVELVDGLSGMLWLGQSVDPSLGGCTFVVSKVGI